MTYKKIILGSLKESFIMMWRNKLWLVLLFIFQILMLVILSAASYHYQLRIVEHSNAIFDYLSKLNLNDAVVADNFLKQKSVLGDDPLLIGREFSEILRNFRWLFGFVFLLLVIFLSMGWTITSKIIYKTKIKDLLGTFLKTLVVLLFYLGLVFSFFYSLLSISLSEMAMQASGLVTKYLIFFFAAAVLLYFMFISLSLSHGTNLNDLLQQTLRIGI